MKKIILILMTIMLSTSAVNAKSGFDTLSDDLKDFIANESVYWQVPQELVLAIIDKESGFKVDAISKSKTDYGLMQIHTSNHKDAYNCFGYTNLLDPYQNLSYGIYKIGTLYNMYIDNIHQALMVYNMGGTKAKEYWKKGIYSTAYSRKVVANWEYYNELLKAK